jgi:PAS domain S-box-containing protein
MPPNYISKVALLAGLYVLTGLLGLQLAIPPGYSTIIWPASGIAIGMLLVHGGRLWPGILLGSFAVNAYHTGTFAGVDWDTTKILAAFLIAAGSTLQALVARAAIEKLIGLPLKLDTSRDIVRLLLLAGPLTCTIAATAGIASLSGLGLVDAATVGSNWIAWWSGDTLGVLVFMPLVLLAPGNRDCLVWRGTTVGQLPLAALVLLLLPLGLTFYAWQTTTENEHQRGIAKFEALTIESEKALQNRLASYANALSGAAGFIQGSTEVSDPEWHTYVNAIRPRDNFPGILGIAWVENVDAAQMREFLGAARTDTPAFAIHPDVAAGPNYIVRHVGPAADNQAALGLNIAFEPRRRAAAELARDTGEPAISGQLELVQDETAATGFVMFHPVYRLGAPQGTVQERRVALRGWASAPFQARTFLAELTNTQHSDYRLRIYDGETETPANLIYSSGTEVASRPAFSKRVSLPILQRQWLMVWESTGEFEHNINSSSPLFLLLGGVLFTALLGLLLIVLTVRRIEHIERVVGERRFAVPLLVFMVLAAGSFALHSKLREKELDFIREQVRTEAGDVEMQVQTQVDERIASLARMAARWEAAGGTPYELWRRDAANHVAQLAGLRALEWIDATYHARWIEPLAGNESTLGLDLRFDARRASALRRAADNSRATLTPPLALSQGYTAVFAYLPVAKQGQFDGFIAAAFDVQSLFAATLLNEPARDYLISIDFEGQSYYSNAGAAGAAGSAGKSWTTERLMRLQDNVWTVRLAPTADFIEAQKSMLPGLVLAAGLLVAALAALSLRYILISRLKSAHLAKSLALNAGIVSSSAHLVIAIDPEYRIMIFNKAAEAALGYSAAEVTGRRAIPIFMDPLELETRARSLSEELNEAIPVDARIFTRIPLRDGYEKREWTFIRKNRSRFPVNAIITPLRDARGAVTGFLGVIEDITLAHEVDRVKSEFTAVVSHELRTPLTSIRGSLGLILGAMSSSLSVKVRDLLEIAQSNCERLLLLVNDILDIEKFSAGQMRFEVQVLPLADVVRQAVEANEGYARKLNVQMELAACPPEWCVGVDPDRFIQVMANLLSNAAKYSPAGGTVRVWCESRAELLRITVHDDGPGIPADYRDHVFERFSQADSSATRAKGGTGLGLYIARRFVEHMHGRIGFDSEAGGGSSFWIELPAATRAGG